MFGREFGLLHVLVGLDEALSDGAFHLSHGIVVRLERDERSIEMLGGLFELLPSRRPHGHVEGREPEPQVVFLQFFRVDRVGALDVLLREPNAPALQQVPGDIEALLGAIQLALVIARQPGGAAEMLERFPGPLGVELHAAKLDQGGYEFDGIGAVVVLQDRKLPPQDPPGLPVVASIVQQDRVVDREVRRVDTPFPEQLRAQRVGLFCGVLGLGGFLGFHVLLVLLVDALELGVVVGVAGRRVSQEK